MVVTLVVCSAFSFPKKNKTNKAVYAFGWSTSFTDSVVYYSEIQVLDSVQLEKNGFLPYRDHYSYQMKNFLEYKKGGKDRMCMIYFGEDKTKLNKTLDKLLNKCKKDPTVRLEMIEQDEFSFTKPED